MDCRTFERWSSPLSSARSWSSPQTPPRRDSHEHDSHATKKASFATDSSADSTAAARPFLAYARRVRSFSSPFQLNKSRYLLTFVDADAAQEWWRLMQVEYPDSVRESPQLFSFKGDKVPGKAWDNPKFAHLKDKWSYKLDDESSKPARDKVNNASNAHVKRGSIGRVPSMPTLREDNHGSPLMEDPFSPSSSLTAFNKAGFAQLNITSDRIHKSVNQTGAQIDALLEGQNASAKGMQKLQATLERMSQEIDTLIQRQQAHEQAMHGAMHGVTYLLEDNASTVKAVSERPQHEVPSEDGWKKLQDEVAQNTAYLESLVNGQKKTVKSIQGLESALEQNAPDLSSSTESLQKIQDGIAQNSAHLASLAKGQTVTKKSIKDLRAAVEYNKPELPTVANFKKIEDSLAQNTSHLSELAEGQTVARKSIKDLQAAFETSKSEPTSAASLQRIEDELAQTSAKLNSLADGQSTTKQTMQDLQSSLEQTKPEPSPSPIDLQKLQEELATNSTYLKTLTDGQRLAKNRMVKLQASLDQQVQAQQEHLQAKPTETLPPPATAANLSTLQTSVDALSTTLATILDNEKATRVRLGKLTTEVTTNSSAAQKSLSAQIAETNTLLKNLLAAQKLLSTQQTTLSTQQATLETRQKAAEQRHAAAEQQQKLATERLLKEQRTAADAQMAAMRAMFAAQQDVFAKGMREMREGMGQMSQVLGYEVCPPPKKLHREIIGYVYGRQ